MEEGVVVVGMEVGAEEMAISRPLECHLILKPFLPNALFNTQQVVR